MSAPKIPVMATDGFEYLVQTMPDPGQTTKDKSVPVVPASDWRASTGLTKVLRTIVIPPFAAGGEMKVTDSTGNSTTTTVPANTAAKLLDANANRRNFRIMNAGTGGASYGYGAGLKTRHGWPLAPADAVGGQGGADEDVNPHVGAIYAASADGTTLIVIEG